MKNRRFLALMMAVGLSFAISVNTTAASPAEKATKASTSVTQTAKTPIGNLTRAERLKLLTKTRQTDVEPYHFSVIPHAHEITQITNQYRGEIDRGVVVETTRRVNTTAELSYEKSRSVSNAYGVSIDFDGDVISSELGYNVTYGTNETASYKIDVPANMMASITLYDMYDVTEFDVMTTFVYNTIPITYSYEYGTGWAQQWTNFGYSSSLW